MTDESEKRGVYKALHLITASYELMHPKVKPLSLVVR